MSFNGITCPVMSPISKHIDIKGNNLSHLLLLLQKAQ